MKQQGGLWIDSKGREVPKEYLSSEQKTLEKLVSQMTTAFQELQERTIPFKEKMFHKCIECLEAHAKKNPIPTTRAVFYNFDRSWKVEWDIKEGNFRFYEKSGDDYQLMVLDVHSLDVPDYDKILMDRFNIDTFIPDKKQENEETEEETEEGLQASRNGDSDRQHLQGEDGDNGVQESEVSEATGH